MNEKINLIGCGHSWCIDSGSLKICILSGIRISHGPFFVVDYIWVNAPLDGWVKRVTACNTGTRVVRISIFTVFLQRRNSRRNFFVESFVNDGESYA